MAMPQIKHMISRLLCANPLTTHLAEVCGMTQNTIISDAQDVSTGLKHSALGSQAYN